MQLLLVDKQITNAKEMFKILDNAVKENYPIVIVAEGIEHEALAPGIRNKLKGTLKAAAIKAPAFNERKSHYLGDIAILTGGIKTSELETFYFCLLKSHIYVLVCNFNMRKIMTRDAKNTVIVVVKTILVG